MADSIYDELDEPDEPDDVDDAAPLGELPASDVFVCDHVDDDGLCGASFANQRGLTAHVNFKHSVGAKARIGTGTRPRKPASRARASKSKDSAPRKAAAKATPASTANRADTYASSIAMAALGAYLVIPPFDTYDLDIINRGAPNLADALAQAGDQNQTIRTTCDLILGGGAGGAYIQLLLALSAMVVPICAHHGLVPASAGARFGEMIGAQPSSAAPAAAPPSAAQDAKNEAPTSGMGQPDFANMDAGEVLQFFSQVPPTVLFDLAGKMFAGVDPDIVNIGDVPQGEAMPMTWAQREAAAAEEQVDVERGSEQLAPDTVAVPS